MSKVRPGFQFLSGTLNLYLITLLKQYAVHSNSLQQLSESEQSEGEADTKEKKAVPPSGKKYIPPKIAAVHYGIVSIIVKQ